MRARCDLRGTVLCLPGRLVAVVATVAAVAIGLAAPASARTAKAPGVETWLDSLVLIDALWTVDLPAGAVPSMPDGSAAPPLKYEATCTGWFPDTDGDGSTHTNPQALVVGAGHCADDGDATEYLQSVYAEYQKLAADAAAAGLGSSTLPAVMPDPKRVIKAVQSSRVEQRALTGVVKLQAKKVVPLEQGDVAVFKIVGSTGKQAIPALPVAVQVPELLTPLAAIGFAALFLDIPESYVQPGAPLHQMLIDVIDPSTLNPTAKDGTVSSRQKMPRTGAIFTDISAAATAGMSGGPVVSLGPDQEGLVLGVISQGADLQPFNLATDTALLRASLLDVGANLDAAAANDSSLGEAS